MTDFGNTEDWIQELEILSREYQSAEGFMSSAEIVESLGMGKSRVLKWLKQIQQEGRLEVRTRYEQNIAGRRQCVPVYKVKTESPQKKPTRKPAKSRRTK